jgi:cytochrome c-type biogenesis protein CcmH/NrfG
VSDRLAWPAALTVGIALAFVLVVRASPTERAGPADEDLARRAASAPGAVGVGTGGTGGRMAAPGTTPTSTGSPLEAFEARVHTLTRAIDEAPRDRELRLELARLLHDGHRPEEAVVHYRAAIELDPDEARAYYDLAAAFAELSAWDDAEAVLRRRRERAPDDAVAMYDLGAIRANRGDVAGALGWWERAEATASDPDLRRRIREAMATLRDGDGP